jgi:hypothetical protein
VSHSGSLTTQGGLVTYSYKALDLKHTLGQLKRSCWWQLGAAPARILVTTVVALVTPGVAIVTTVVVVRALDDPVREAVLLL